MQYWQSKQQLEVITDLKLYKEYCCHQVNTKRPHDLDTDWETLDLNAASQEFSLTLSATGEEFWKINTLVPQRWK